MRMKPLESGGSSSFGWGVAKYRSVGPDGWILAFKRQEGMWEGLSEIECPSYEWVLMKRVLDLWM